MSSLSVAIDVTPLVGHATGIARFVEHLIDAHHEVNPDLRLARFVMSRGARRLDDDIIKLPFPARLTNVTWGHVDWPSGRRQLGFADVIHATNYVAPPTGQPTVLTVHDCSFVTNPKWCSPTVRRFAPIVQRSIDRGAWIHTATEHVAAQIRHFFGAERLRVIPYGAPDRPAIVDDQYVQGLSGRPYVLALGRIEPRKNLARLIEAFGLVHADHPELHLVIVGPDGTARPQIDAAISRLDPSAGAQVIFTGFLDDQHTAAVIRGAQLLAYPSLEEGFGFPVLEAMDLGVPVVTSLGGTTAEVSGGAAVLVDPADSGSIASAIATTLEDSALRHRLITAGHQRVLQFSWSSTATELERLYDHAVRR